MNFHGERKRRAVCRQGAVVSGRMEIPNSSASSSTLSIGPRTLLPFTRTYLRRVSFHCRPPRLWVVLFTPAWVGKGQREFLIPRVTCCPLMENIRHVSAPHMVANYCKGV